MVETLPDQMKTEALDAKHEEYAESIDAWGEIELLAAGGSRLRREAERFLLKRPKELHEIYQARLRRFTYQNILGSALGWYAAAMFEVPPEIIIRAGETVIEGGGEYASFLKNATRNGCGFAEFWRGTFLDLLRFGCSYVLTDLPATTLPEGATREQQRVAGALDPYIVRYGPGLVTNWETDAFGNLEWLMVSHAITRREVGRGPAITDTWTIYDRTGFARYEAVRREPKQKAEIATLAAKGPHALAEVGRVPLRKVSVPPELWLGDRALLPVRDHLNQDNSLGWALFMSNLPVPVIKGNFEGNAKVSETAYIHLSENGSFEFAESSGSSFQAGGERLASLREEIHRGMYLQAQGRSTEATPAAQSGLSKEMDMQPGRNVLSGVGDILRGAMERTLEDVRDARGDRTATFTVQGFDFDDDAAEDEIKQAQASVELPIQSPTLMKVATKRAARAILRDELPETIAAVEREIDAGETPEEREARQADEQAKRIGGRLSAAAGVAA